MNFIKKSIFFAIISSFLSFSAKADINVVTTIKPLHSLISNVMKGVGEPSLIIEGTSNPHNFVLKPSHAKLLEDADIIFWIGEDLEAFMEKPLSSLAKDAEKISFIELGTIEKLKFREDNIFEHDDHDEHDGHKEDEHDDHDEHDGHKEDEHDDHDEHNHGEFDAHLWLDPVNAKKMVIEISHELSELDPANKNTYMANADKTIEDLDRLIKEVNRSLSKDISYVVFHDAYQYFEKRFGVTSAGALTLNPDVLPGAKQIIDIQNLIKEKNIKCIFSEPQYNPKIIETLANDTNILTGTMDPLGANLDSGATMYIKLIMNIANSIKNCS
jgi:zinc transport system substrate-binding protein